MLKAVAAHRQAAANKAKKAAANIAKMFKAQAAAMRGTFKRDRDPLGNTGQEFLLWDYSD